MTTLVIKFPKLGQQTSTWVDEEWWSTLTPAQQEQCIYRFVKNTYPHELAVSKRSTAIRFKSEQDYTWNVL